MSEAKEITDDLEIIDLLKVISSSKEKVWIWQNDKDRLVFHALIKKVDPLSKLVHVHPTSSKGFHFSSKDNVFLYSAKKLVATKIIIRELEDEYMIFSLPKKVMRVSESFVDGLEFVEKENEGAHVHERTHDRNEIHGEKFIKVHFPDQPPKNGKIYYLNDISKSGLSFRVDDPGEFHKGDSLEVSEMNGKILTPFIKGEVMSVRELPNAAKEYKIGLRFT